MLKKCLKYDFRSVFRLWWIMAVSMLGAAVVGGLGIRFFSQCASSPDVPEGLLVLSTFAMIGSMFCLMAMVMGMTVSFILVFWRMYTHFYTDEGYLTFTLPVKRSTLYLSKVITCTVVELASLAVILIGGVCAVLIAIPFDAYPYIPQAFREMGTAFTEMWGSVGIWPLVWLLLMPLFMVANLLASNGLVLLCLTLGSAIFKKGKLIASIGIYWLVNRLSGVLAEIVVFPLIFGMSGLMMVMESAGGFVTGLTVTVAILIGVAMTACGAALLHFINLTILERKLNLA